MTAKENKTMEVPLEEWAEQLIDRTITKHLNQCPVRMIVEGGDDDKSKSLVIRVDRIERILRFAAWLITPVYVAGVGMIINKLFALIGN